MTGELYPVWDSLHPIARGPFIALANDLHFRWSTGLLGVWFRPFELVRSPERQLAVFKDGKSKARPWESAHQYGLAVDFVPFVRGKFSWAVSSKDWDDLRNAAHARGLLNDIAWDRAHVEHPAFARVREALRPVIQGSTP